MALSQSAIGLLWDDASAAQQILQGQKPPMSSAEYLAFQRGINRTEAYDGAAF